MSDEFSGSVRSLSRREAMRRGASAVAAGAIGLAAPQMLSAESIAAVPSRGTLSDAERRAAHLPPGVAGRDYTPVITPDGVALPWRIVDGVKVFHLIAEAVQHTFAPGLEAECWGYNGRTIGPTIEAVEGDRVRIYVTNKLSASTSLHWHGILLPAGMDGVSGLTQMPIEPGQTFRYEFTLRQHGTFMYHPHRDEMTQQAMGMMGMFIVHPRHPTGRHPDRDFVLLTNEWKVTPGTRRPDPLEMVDFNVFTFNSKTFPATTPLLVQRGDRVRIRLGNLSPMSHHPIHLHGHAWTLVATDGGDIARSAQWTETTQLVPAGSTRTMEFVADNPGDWGVHCHMTHHAMNQMGHPGVNMIGVNAKLMDRAVQSVLPSYMTMGAMGMSEMGDMGMALPRNSISMTGGEGPFGSIDMGGLFTLLKVRDVLHGNTDPGWYEHPLGTVAEEATGQELRRDGISTEH